MDKVIEKWDEILQTVKRDYNISDVAFNTWLKPLEVYDVTDNIITILVPSEQVVLINLLNKKYKLLLYSPGNPWQLPCRGFPFWV